MDKPTIFFSHSSKDSAFIIPIKNKITEITGKTLNIFMSSDGQSIPFGNNWVHKIEEGLNNAQIMFVFITPNSIDSAWIYFEAGFAYSKSIEVVPVGIDVNIGELNPPLNLLQGFNITSTDNLNKFITIINKKFDLEFKKTFNDEDYESLFSKKKGSLTSQNMSDIFTHAEYELYSFNTYDIRIFTLQRLDLEKMFNKIKNYFDHKHIVYEKTGIREITIAGILQIKIIGDKRSAIVDMFNMPDIDHFLLIKVSTKSFIKSFELLKKLLLEIDFEKEFREENQKQYTRIQLYLNHIYYDCINDKLFLSSIISENSLFEYGTIIFDTVWYNYKNISFFFSENERNGDIIISFETIKTSVEDIMELIQEMLKCGLIFKI